MFFCFLMFINFLNLLKYEFLNKIVKCIVYLGLLLIINLVINFGQIDKTG